jgi:hypothetical protein
LSADWLKQAECVLRRNQAARELIGWSQSKLAGWRGDNREIRRRQGATVNVGLVCSSGRMYDSGVEFVDDQARVKLTKARVKLTKARHEDRN